MRTLLCISAIALLSSCAGKGFLHQRYTHYAHTKYQEEKKVHIPEPEEQEKVAAVERKDISFTGPEREITGKGIQELPAVKPQKDDVGLPTTVSSPTQPKTTALIRGSAQKVHTARVTDPFDLLVFIVWVLIVLFLLAIILSIIGLIVLLASHIITGIILLTIGLVGLAIWLIYLA